jgi:hypothetical protein
MARQNKSSALIRYVGLSQARKSSEPMEAGAIPFIWCCKPYITNIPADGLFCCKVFVFLGWLPTLKMEVIHSCETLVHIRTTWHYIPKGGNIHNYRCESLNSYKPKTSCSAYLSTQYSVTVQLITWTIPLSIDKVGDFRAHTCGKMQNLVWTRNRATRFLYWSLQCPLQQVLLLSH